MIKKFKKCNKCDEIKSITIFYRDKKNKDGYRNICKDCQDLSTKNWRKNNPEKTNAISRKWKRANPKKIQEKNRRWYKNNKEYFKNYRKNNIKTLKETSKNWETNNPEARKKIYKKFYSIPKNKLSGRILYSMSHSLKTNKSGNYWEDLVGYTLQDLITHFKSKLKEGMTLENYGKWQIDHILPISSFNFNSYKDKEFKKCWGLDNLQPLWANENMSKGNKI